MKPWILYDALQHKTLLTRCNEQLIKGHVLVKEQLLRVSVLLKFAVPVVLMKLDQNDADGVLMGLFMM